MPSDDRTERRIYLDFNASTPVAPEVYRIMERVSKDGFGNPSSSHWASRPARRALEIARQQVADLIGCAPGEVVFTSGGSEANNWAIKGIVAATSRVDQPHIITSTIEHPSILEVCAAVERQGVRVTRLGVDRGGRVDPDHLRAAIDEQHTVLISLMWANNEVGTIQPIDEIGEIARSHGIPLHTDAAQAVGKIDLSESIENVDLLTIAGHKLYAPKGVGALIVRRGVRLEPLIHGGGQEGGQRAGTESAMLAAGLGEACRLAGDRMTNPEIGDLRDRLWRQLRSGLGSQLLRNGDSEHCLPNTLNISVTGWRGADLLERLRGVAASTGSACHDAAQSPSPVLTAMGLSRRRAAGAIRFSVGSTTTRDEVDWVAAECVRICSVG